MHSTTRNCLVHCILVLTHPLLLPAMGFTSHGTRTFQPDMDNLLAARTVRLGTVNRDGKVMRKVLVKKAAQHGGGSKAITKIHQDAMRRQPLVDSYGAPLAPPVLHNNQTTSLAPTTHHHHYHHPQEQQQQDHQPPPNRRPRFLVFPDGTFIMNMFKISFPLPVCQFEGSPCSKILTTKS